MNNLIQAIFYNNPDAYPPVINSARLLAQAGFNLNIYCRDDGSLCGVKYPQTVHVDRIKAAATGSWREYSNFIQEVLRSDVSAVRLFLGHDMHGLVPAWILSARHRRPLIYHCHDFAESGRKIPMGSHIVRTFERLLARTADLVIVPDADRAAVVARQLRLRRKPLVVANAPLERPVSSGRALHESLVVKGKQFEKIVLRQGRIGVGHAIEATIRSMPHWANRRWGFALLGAGEPSYLEHLNALAQELGVQERFITLPPVPYDHVAQYTGGADVGHALYEPIHINNVHITTASNKIMEYMAAGLPLLVSDAPSLRGLVERYGCGAAADEKSPASIATAVNLLLGDPHRSQQMGAAAARAFEQEFRYERQFAPVLSAIQDLVARGLSRAQH